MSVFYIKYKRERGLFMFTAEKIQSLNELELEVYGYIMQHKNAISYMRIREVATEAHVSTTTVLRFCKKMGCDGYSEFKLKMKEYNKQKSIHKISENLSEIKAFFERLETEKFQSKLEEAAAMIAKMERVLFTGIGTSGHIGQYGARCFTNIGKFSLCISDPYCPINMQETENTVVIVLSVSGETGQTIKIVNALKRCNCKIISITNTKSCTISKLSDINISYYITMHQDEEHTDYTSQVPAISIIEALANKIRNRLTEE